MKIKASAVLLALLAVPAAAQFVINVPPYRTVANLGTCTDGAPKLVTVTNGAGPYDCVIGGGTTEVICACRDGAWLPQSPIQSATGTLSGPPAATTTTGAGGEFALAGQPQNDGIEILSSDAGDTQNATIIGTTQGTDTVVVETLPITGIVATHTAKTDWGFILAVKLSSPAVGNIAFMEDSGNVTFIGFTPGQSSKGVETVLAANQPMYGRLVSLVASGASTKMLGLKGTNAAGVLQYDAQALSGTTAVTSNLAFGTITEIYTGDVAAATASVTVSAYTSLPVGSSIVGGITGSSTLTIDGDPVAAGSVTIDSAGAVTAAGRVTAAGVTSSASLFFDNPSSAGADVGFTQINGIPVFYFATGAYLAQNGEALELRKTTTAQAFRIYGTADAFGTNTNYERMDLTCASAGNCSVGTSTAGTGTDAMNLSVIAGSDAASVLTLDGSAGTAGAVTVSAAGLVSTPETAVGTMGYGFAGSTYGMQSAGGGYVGINGATVTLRGYGTPNLTVGQTIVGVSSSVPFAFGTIATSTYDTALVRADTSTLRVTNASTGMGSFLSLKKVVADTDGETTTAVQSGTLWTNTGDADGEAITLLNDPGVGTQYCFAVDAATTITVAPSTGESLYYGTDQCVVSLTSNTTGSTLCVVATVGGSGGKWMTMSSIGSWTCND